MAITKANAAPNAPIPQPSHQGGIALPPTPEKISSKIDLAISLSLHLWPALKLAVQNQWGGPASTEKREWFAGAISELFVSRPDTDAEDVEAMLLQVMSDEFEVNVEDESSWEVAARIVALRAECLRGEFGGVDELYATWLRMKGVHVVGEFREGEGDGEQEEEEEEGSSEEGEDEDVDMEEAPALVVGREKLAPEVDDEGFIMVTGKKKR